MEENKPHLRKVPIEYLWAGLVLLDDLYNYCGEVLLIPKGSVLTEGKLQKLIKFEAGNKYITTYDATYQKIMEKCEKTPEIRQKMFEDKFGYTDLKRGIEDILHMAHCVQKISGDQIETTIQNVADRLENTKASVIFECIDMPRPMDEALQRHCLNVSFLNGLMGEWLHLSKQDVKLLITAGVLHDVGKTKIPEEILDAPRKLTAEEFAVVKKHPVYSYELLGDEFGEKVKQAVLMHHEKNDGSGYPCGLKEEQIPLFAKIMAITDIYDAMVSKRSYKEERLLFDILDSFYEKSYAGLDEELTAVFLKNMRKQLLEKEVIMSDGAHGIVRFIPPNDFEHPVIESGHTIRQTDEKWYCVGIL